MSITWNIYLLTGSVLCACVYGTRLSKVDVASSRAIKELKPFTLAIVFALLINLMSILHIMLPAIHPTIPLVIRFYSSAVIFGINLFVLSFVCVSTMVLAIQTNHRRKRKVSILLMTAIVVYQALQFSSVFPIAFMLKERVSGDEVILQSSGVSCAAATCANIAAFYGIDISEKEMAELLGTTIHGTSRLQVLYGMEKLGLQTRVADAKSSNLDLIHAPALLNVDHPAVGTEAHAVAYMGQVGGEYEIWDPLKGQVFLTFEEVRAIWHGRAIEFSR